MFVNQSLALVMFMLLFGLLICGGVLGGASIERKGEANSFFRIIVFLLV